MLFRNAVDTFLVLIFLAKLSFRILSSIEARGEEIIAISSDLYLVNFELISE